MNKLCIVVVLFGGTFLASASLLRTSVLNRQTQLFDKCSYVGTECRAPNSICALAHIQPVLQRFKRDLAAAPVGYAIPILSKKPELLIQKPLDSRYAASSGNDQESNSDAGEEYNNNNNKNQDDDQEATAQYQNNDGGSSGGQQQQQWQASNKYGASKVIDKGVVNLGTTVKKTQETRVTKSRRDKWLKKNSYSRVDTKLKTVKTNVRSHTINEIVKPLEVVHVQKNHLVTVVNHKYPKVINVDLLRWRKIVKPERQTVVQRTTSKKVKWQIEPTQYVQKTKKVRLPTRWVPLQDLGVVDTGNAYQNENNNKNDYGSQNENSNGGGGLYKQKVSQSDLYARMAPIQDEIDRFKREAVVDVPQQDIEAVCMCAESFVPTAMNTGCECPQGQSVQAGGYCA